MWTQSLVYPVIRTHGGALSTQAVGLQTRLHCFLRILQSAFQDDGGGERWLLLVNVELFSLWPSGEKPGWMGLSRRGCEKGGIVWAESWWRANVHEPGEAEGIPGDGQRSRKGVASWGNQDCQTPWGNPHGSTTYRLCSLGQLSHLWAPDILLLLKWDLLLAVLLPLGSDSDASPDWSISSSKGIVRRSPSQGPCC